jgi:Ca2+-binding RTX toxin-like protein
MTIKTGTAASETLIGTTGADQLFGKDGNDILKGLGGPDLLDGGNGTDTANYSGSTGLVNVDLDNGPGSGGDAQGDTYISVENVVGSSSQDTLNGNSLANKLDGGRGFDFLIGDGGNDTLLGGGSGDFLAGNTGADVINGGDGRDILSYASSALGVNVNLSTGQATGGDAAGDNFTSIESLVGSASGSDILAGSAVANFLNGGGGADQMFGFAGNDTVQGDGGADIMTGGDGADTFAFVSPQDSPAGFLARDVIQDFSHAQGDVLDLHDFDANTENGTFDRFEFLGDARVDDPGRITYTFEGNNTVVQINTVGGGTPEMEIQLQGHVDLLASDFIL